MDYLDAFVKLLLFSSILCHSHAHDLHKRSIFSWGKEASTKVPDAIVPGYLPTLKVHKYNGIQINPLHGSPIYLPNALSESSNAITLEQFPTAHLSSEHVQQLDILNKVVSFLPDEDRMHEYDLTALLPYVDLISEDSLEKLQYVVESSKEKQNSKLAKLIGFLKSIKEKKLKPFKYAAHVGSALINKKKEKVQTAFSYLGQPFAEVTTQAPQIVSEILTPPIGYPFNPLVVPGRPMIYPTNPFLGIPSADQPQQPFQTNPFQEGLSADQQQQFTPNRRVESLVQNSQFYGFPHHYLSPAGTFLQDSNSVQAYTLAPPQNDRLSESTPSSQSQFSESQYQQLPYSFPQHNYPPASQSQSFAKQKNQFQNQLDTAAASQFSSQAVNQHVVFNAMPPSLIPQGYQFAQQNTNINGETYRENSAQNNVKHENTKYYQTPSSNNYASMDLAGSASENVEIGERNSKPATAASADTENEKNNVQETVTANTVENHHHNIIVPSSVSKSKITKLHPVTGESPIHIVYPNTLKNKETDNNESSVPSVQNLSNS